MGLQIGAQASGPGDQRSPAIGRALDVEQGVGQGFQLQHWQGLDLAREITGDSLKPEGVWSSDQAKSLDQSSSTGSPAADSSRAASRSNVASCSPPSSRPP